MSLMTDFSGKAPASLGSRTPEALLPSGAEAAYSIRYGNRPGTSIVTWPWVSAGKGGKAMGTPGTWAIHESVALPAERPAASCSVKVTEAAAMGSATVSLGVAGRSEE